MARVKFAEDNSILEMALVGYQFEKQKIEAKVIEIQAQLKGKKEPVAASEENADKPAKRFLSPAARKRIAAAQKKRWAEHRKRAAQNANAE